MTSINSIITKVGNVRIKINSPNYYNLVTKIFIPETNRIAHKHFDPFNDVHKLLAITRVSPFYCSLGYNSID